MEDRARTLALLEANHEFPGPYAFRVVAKPGAAVAIVTAVSAVTGIEVADVDEKASKKGNWVSVRMTLQADSADAVLMAYEILGEVDGVVMTL
jgi:putative lipoic acid-binding regulatory protein